MSQLIDCNLCHAIPHVVVSCAGEPNNVDPQATEALLPQNSDQPSCKGCHVGSPQLFIPDPPSHSRSSSSSTTSVLSDSCSSSLTDTESSEASTESAQTASAALQDTKTQVASACDVPHNAAPAPFDGDEEMQTAWAQQGVICHRQAGLKVVVRLQGQGSNEQPLGSWGLDQEQHISKEVQQPCHVCDTAYML